MSPALAGGFLPTAPPGKSLRIFFVCLFWMWTFLKVFIEFVYNIVSVLCFGSLAMWDLSFLTTPLALEGKVLSTGEVPILIIVKCKV